MEKINFAKRITVILIVMIKKFTITDNFNILNMKFLIFKLSSNEFI